MLTLPSTLIERVFFWGCVSQFLLYFAGLGPYLPLLVGWPLVLLAAWDWLRVGGRPPLLVMVWLLCMGGLLVESLMVTYSTGKGASAIVWWFMRYAIAALVPLAGGLIRPAVIVSALAILGVQALGYCGVAGLAKAAGIPLGYQALVPGGLFGDPLFVRVCFSHSEVAQAGVWRLIGFTHNSNYGGAVACLYALPMLMLRGSWVKWTGLAGWLLLLVFTYTRTSIIFFPVGVAIYLLLGPGRRFLLLAAGVSLLAGAALSGPILRTVDRAKSFVHSTRAASSLTRANLRQIAMEDWRYGSHQVLGAGEAVPGGDIVEDIDIGTHDSVAAVLYLRGALGLCLLFVPMIFTVVFAVVTGSDPLTRCVAVLGIGFLVHAYSVQMDTLFIFGTPLMLLIGAAAYREQERTRAGTLPATPALAS